MDNIAGFKEIVKYWQDQVDYWESHPQKEGPSEKLAWCKFQLEKYKNNLKEAEEARKNEQG